MTTETILILVGSIVGSSALSVYIKGLFDKKESNARVENLASDVYEKVINLKNKESLEDKEKIRVLEDRERILERQHADCELKSVALQVKLNLWESRMKSLNISIDDVKKFKVFVLDDDEFTLAAFKKKLEIVPIIDVSTFESLPPIIARINEMPEFLILDYKVHGQTIDEFITQVIKMEMYDPKIILISGMPIDFFSKLPYRGFIWMYFAKEEGYEYINKPVNEIMLYVNEVIKK